MADKNYILAEIKRTAAANGGAALGSKRFSTETGIRETEWGRFWVRWGDALIEAGFKPNEFITAYSEDVLLQRLARSHTGTATLPIDSRIENEGAN